MEPWRRPARVAPDPDAADEVPMPHLNVPNLQNRSRRTREARWLLAGCLMACVPSAGPGAQNAEPKPASPSAAQPLQAELRASPPPPAPVNAGRGASDGMGGDSQASAAMMTIGTAMPSRMAGLVRRSS